MTTTEVNAQVWRGSDYEIICMPNLLILRTDYFAFVFRGPRDMTRFPATIGNEHQLAEHVIGQVRGTYSYAAVQWFARNFNAMAWRKIRKAVASERGEFPENLDCDEASEVPDFYFTDHEFRVAYRMLRHWYQTVIAPLKAA